MAHSCLAEMGLFFGGFNQAGCDFVNYNSMGLNFETKLVTGNNYNELMNHPMYALLLAQSHKQSVGNSAK